MRYNLLSFLILPLLVSAGIGEQQILSPSHEMAEPFTPATNSKPTLADILTIESSASIFYSYARELETSERFTDVDAYSTIVAPSNKAVMALARKPHQGPVPADETIIITEQEFDEQSKKNVQRWVSAHIIPDTPITLPSSRSYPTMLEAKSIKFNEIDGGANSPAWTRVVIEDNIHVIAMKEAINGVLLLVDGTIKTE